MQGTAYVQRGGGPEDHPGWIDQKETRTAKAGGLKGPPNIRGQPPRDAAQDIRGKEPAVIEEVGGVARPDVKETEAMKQIGAAPRPGSTSDGIDSRGRGRNCGAQRAVRCDGCRHGIADAPPRAQKQNDQNQREDFGLHKRTPFCPGKPAKRFRGRTGPLILIQATTMPHM